MTGEPTDEPIRGEDDRYRYSEYRHESRMIAVIQDAENDRAWIQSTAVVPTDP